MTNQPNAAVPGIKTNYVYFLFDPSTNLVKIGHSSTPGSRVSTLTGRYPGIDLSRSALVEADTRALEYVLHAVFSHSRQSFPVSVDGGTEWFDARIFDEALSFAKYVGEVRGQDYSITHDLTQLVDGHRRETAARWVAGSDDRSVQQRLTPETAMALLADVASERAEDCLEILAERQVTGLVTDGNQWAIERTVERHLEPELWTEARFSPQRWSSRLTAAATVVAPGCEVYGRSFCALTGVTLERDPDTAQEFIHLPHNWRALSTGEADLPRRNFFAPLAEFLLELPVRRVAAGSGPFASCTADHATEQ